jgi:hypothetical protein
MDPIMDKAPSHGWPGRPDWGFLEKIVFRFAFVYFLLFIEPWMWLLDFIPAISQYIHQAKDWLVNAANSRLFHTYTELVPLNGSGDTSYGWTELKLELLLALAAALVWTLADKGRANYNRLSYWLRIFIRYNLIAALLGYGVIKMFCMQMVFPSLSQLATPLGDLLPMRLSWLFIGYSNEYQFFSGLMELLAAVLLFFRRTAAFGAVVSAAVFSQVAVMNLSYDIPVKIFSIHLFISSVVLMIYERKRLLSFILNRPSAPSDIYDVTFGKRWQRILRLVFKYGLTIYLLSMTLYGVNEQFSMMKASASGPIPKGIYDVKVFALNRDTLPVAASLTDSLRWKDIVFEGGSGSVNTTDTLFRQRYRRGYFDYIVNDSLKTLVFNRPGWTGARDSVLTFRYDMPDSIHIRLWGRLRNDSLYLELEKSERHFQLTERQFHWLSEYNR